MRWLVGCHAHDRGLAVEVQKNSTVCDYSFHRKYTMRPKLTIMTTTIITCAKLLQGTSSSGIGL